MASTDRQINALPVVVGITGASGSILGFEMVRALLQLHIPVELVISSKSFQVIFEELGLNLANPGADGLNQHAAVLNYLQIKTPDEIALLTVYSNNQTGALPASGTHLTRGMVVIPCSMTTLGKLASGVTDNLVARAADVTLKERRPLILVPRESPFNRIHLENMLRLHDAGARIIPPVLAFYQQAFQSVEGQIRYTLGKVLDQLGVHDHRQFPRWGETESVPTGNKNESAGNLTA